MSPMEAAGSKRWLAWGLALLAPLLSSARLVLPAAAGALDLRPIDLLAPAMLLAFGAVGLLVARRQPGNAIGWIFLGVAVSLGLAGAARGFGEARLHDGPDPSRIVG